MNQVGNRDAILRIGPGQHHRADLGEMVDSRTVELTANDNTPYTWFWLDLRKGPLVLEVPPKVLGLVNDMWYHWVATSASPGRTRARAASTCSLPPGYKGEVPEGYHVVRPGHVQHLGRWRSFLVDGDPKPGVDVGEEDTEDLSAWRDGANPPPTELRQHVRASRSTWSPRPTIRSGSC